MPEPVLINANESILATIKKLLGVDDADTSFDTDIIIYINTALFVLTQLGAGPTGGYSITNRENKWSDFLGSIPKLESIKTYIYLKVRLVFDPPQYLSVIDALTRAIAEYEWRILTLLENSVAEVVVPTPIVVEGSPI